jgi:hypothetical protein
MKEIEDAGADLTTVVRGKLFKFNSCNHSTTDALLTRINESTVPGKSTPIAVTKIKK